MRYPGSRRRPRARRSAGGPRGARGRRPPAGSAQADGTGQAPRDVLIALLDRLPKPVSLGKSARFEVLRTVVRGRRRGRVVTVTTDCLVGPRAGGGVGPDIDTGAPPSIAGQLLIGGEIPLRPGVSAP